jgi:cation:H+ antiporter
MWLNLLYIVIGAALVLWGADRLTEGASNVARRMNVPEIIIGLTIVAAGTSAPELFVSFVSALKGTPDLAVGNVVGSNVFNTMLIVGCSAVVAPMAISKSTVTKDIPFAVVAAVLLYVVCLDGFRSPHLWGNQISRWDGLVLLAGFVCFMVYTFHEAYKSGLLKRKVPEDDEDEDRVKFYYEEEEERNRQHVVVEQQSKLPNLWLSLLFIVIGLGCLIFGSDLFVSAASSVAVGLGVKQSVVGLTIVAGGTSLPELATSVVAARKGKSAMAIGNVIGSNVFNVLLILGVTAVVCPMRIMGITIIDLTAMLVSMVLVWMFAYTKYTVSRHEGAILIASFFCYMGWLLYNL